MTPDDSSGADRTPSAGSSDGAAESGQAGIPVTRRQAIAGGGLVALLGAGVGISHLLRPAAAVYPTVPAADLEENGWVKIDETAETVLDDAAGPIAVEAVSATVQYENRGLLAELRTTEVTIEFAGQTLTETLGDHLDSGFEGSLGVFAAAKIDLTPHLDELPGGLGRAEVMGPVQAQATDQFEAQLRNAGLENVRQVGTDSLDVATGETASLYEYAADFPVPETQIPVAGTTLTVPATELAVAGYLAVWHNGANVVLAAGAHPDENYTDAIDETVAGEEYTLSFDLGLTPASLREELLGYMKRVR